MALPGVKGLSIVCTQAIPFFLLKFTRRRRVPTLGTRLRVTCSKSISSSLINISECHRLEASLYSLSPLLSLSLSLLSHITPSSLLLSSLLSSP